MDMEMLKELREYTSNLCFIALSKLSDKNARENVVAYGEGVKELIDEVIARQSATSEEVAEAIVKIEKIVAFDNEHGYRVNNHHSMHISDIKTALVAMKAYQPWIPVSERLPEEGAIVMVAYGEAIYFASIQYWGIHGKEVPVWRVGMGHRIEKDFSETHWKPYPETPKGE